MTSPDRRLWAPNVTGERVYALPGRYGILIHTGTSDAEGTLGGLVEAGRRLGDHLRQALETGRLCSNDAVCADHYAGTTPTSGDFSMVRPATDACSLPRPVASSVTTCWIAPSSCQLSRPRMRPSLAPSRPGRAMHIADHSVGDLAQAAAALADGRLAAPFSSISLVRLGVSDSHGLARELNQLAQLGLGPKHLGKPDTSCLYEEHRDSASSFAVVPFRAKLPVIFLH
jgi:hypothetical protein